MTIEEMHYDFKTKINKIDTQSYRNLKIPEIDWALNEAQELFVKLIAEPRIKNGLGFETSQRSIDDIRTIVVNHNCVPIINNIATLPNNYWHFIGAEIEMEKGACTDVKGKFHVKQHDDEFEISPFDRSSFEWRVVNGVFFEGGVKFYTDGTFTLNNFCLSYIRKLAYIHYASGFNVVGYNLPSGTSLSGTVNCELPEHTHREIVDLAVKIKSGEIQSPDYKMKLDKLNMNKIS